MICEFTCIVCGKSCRKRRSPANVKSDPKYCSQKCHGEDRKGKGPGRAKTAVFDCAVCDKHVETYRSPAQIRDAKYCSLKCLGLAQLCENNPAFSGGRVLLNNGYFVCLATLHPNADSRGYVLEHRLVMEDQIGRFLTKKEVVHHIDGNPWNNHPSNLRLFASQAEHLAHHRESK